MYGLMLCTWDWFRWLYPWLYYCTLQIAWSWNNLTDIVASSRQLIFLVNVRSQTTPLSAIFPLSSPQPLIPFSPFWTFLCIVQHLHDIILLDPKPFFTIPHLMRSFRAWPITLIPPFVSIILRKDFVQTAWWCLPAILSILPAVVQFWIAASKEDLDKLDRLRYKAKGAWTPPTTGRPTPVSHRGGDGRAYC